MNADEERERTAQVKAYRTRHAQTQPDSQDRLTLERDFLKMKVDAYNRRKARHN